MDKISYVFVIGSLMYAQVCTLLDITFAINVLGKYLSNLDKEYWRATKKVMWY